MKRNWSGMPCPKLTADLNMNLNSCNFFLVLLCKIFIDIIDL